MTFLKAASTVFWKDVLCELRGKEIVLSVLVFALLIIVMFSFAFEPGGQTARLVAPGILWVGFAFAGVLGLNRSFAIEKERGSIDGLLLCPVGREAIFAGKMASSLVFMLVVEVVLLPLFAVLYNLPFALAPLLLIAVITTIGFSAVGCLFSAMAVNTRAREIMLPLLFFPLVSPILIAAVKASGIVLAGQSLSEAAMWLEIIGAFDLIFVAISAVAFEYVLEE
jgi:heme exporter protein B